MAYSRYSKREIFLNNDKNYKNVFFKDRDVQEIFQYDSPQILMPSPEQMSGINFDIRVWRATDKLYNISSEMYGSPTYWWVIAWANQKASEAEFKTGDQYFIPMPLEKVLGYIG